MKPKDEKEFYEFFLRQLKFIGIAVLAIAVLGFVVIYLAFFSTALQVPQFGQESTAVPASTVPASALRSESDLWIAPDLASLPAGQDADRIRYGQELIVHTAKYLGPQGSVGQVSNGMNCQNCHLNAGTKPYGNNYSLVATTYPKIRARSGTEEDVVKRINDCFERSLNGKALAADSEEMQAMAAYITWLGKEVPKGEKAKGAGLIDIAMLDRPASPALGRAIYAEKCQSCHGQNGEGLKLANNPEYQYPPLWGEHSYNIGAGLYRISNFARYAKANMPLGATHDNPLLSDEEAWDLAAFVNSMPHPSKDISKDWPDISTKPYDHPFGPYKDYFSETQHKYGPYAPIIAAKKE